MSFFSNLHPKKILNSLFIAKLGKDMEKFAVTNDINERFNKVEERFSNYLKSEIFEKQKEKMEEGLKI